LPLSIFSLLWARNKDWIGKMKLDEAQKKKVIQWIEEGLKLSDIQSKLVSELDAKLTYMEVRFLIDDLGVKPKDKEPPAAPAEIKPAAQVAQPAKAPGQAAPSREGGGVSVAVDQVTRPGALVSGKVTFSDGKTADWYLDQMGRLGVAPQEQGYKPSPEDLTEFQTELQNELSRLGF
jgi:hypothetical protein